MKLFSKITFIFNVSFVIFILLGYIEFSHKKSNVGNNIIPLPFVTGVLVILGVLAVFINFIFCLAALIPLFSKKMKQPPRAYSKLPQQREGCDDTDNSTGSMEVITNRDQEPQPGMTPAPQWLLIVNFIFLLVQVYYFFI
ncbi:MAG: hypothetical protein ABI707_20310 [Ferruginibacter sp.]